VHSSPKESPGLKPGLVCRKIEALLTAAIALALISIKLDFCRSARANLGLGQIESSLFRTAGPSLAYLFGRGDRTAIDGLLDIAVP
jgi:hypothetical protein